MANKEAFSLSPLKEPARLPLRPGSTVARFGRTLVVAPHPDDETLACGGAMALLQRQNIPVQILVISDGTLSHPNSRKYPAPALKELRENETRAALEILGIPAGKATFLEMKDRSVPGTGVDGYKEAVERCRHYLENYQPETILLPWRRDPHPDHRATFSLLNAANLQLKKKARLLEYPVWTFELAEGNDAPRWDEVEAWRLDISAVNELKQQAIRAYLSQVTNLIDDDPQGFTLDEVMLNHFAPAWEIYLEENNSGVKNLFP